MSIKVKILKRELAEMLGCLPIVVSRLVKKGEVKAETDGKIDISSTEMQDYIKVKKQQIQLHKEKLIPKDKKVKLENLNKINNSNPQQSTNNSDLQTFHSIEYETKKHKLDSEKYKAELLEMEVKQRKKDLINTELLNKIISKTIGNLSKNIVEIPINIVDEIIDIVKTEEEPKPIIINLITKSLHKEIEVTIDKCEKEFLKV